MIPRRAGLTGNTISSTGPARCITDSLNGVQNERDYVKVREK